LAEFSGLQSLQQAGIPAPQAIALLMGFHLDSRLGDAVISQAIEPAQTLDRYLHPFELTAGPIPRRREIAAQLLHLLNALAKAHLGHADLHLGISCSRKTTAISRSFSWTGDAVRRGGLRRSHLFQLAHSLARYATRSDVQRGWELLGPGGRLPRSNPLSRRIWATFMRRITGENDYFGRLEPADAQGWSGVFFKQYKYPYRWSGLSQSRITRQDWLGAWPQLLQAIQADTLQVIKRSRSGDVLATRLKLGAQEVDVIVKRPRRRYWYRYVNEIGRGGRARRAWAKAWCLVIRNLPVAWPVLLMEKRRFGYVTEPLWSSSDCPVPLWRSSISIPWQPARAICYSDAGAHSAAHRRPGNGPLRRQIEQLDRVRRFRPRPHAGDDRPGQHSPAALDRPGRSPFAAQPARPQPVHAGGFAGVVPGICAVRPIEREQEA